MNVEMTIARSFIDGRFLLREGDYIWRLNEEGEVEQADYGIDQACELRALIRKNRMDQNSD